MFLQKITKHRTPIIFSIIVLAVLALPVLTLAAGILPACADSGDCGICDVVQTAVNVFRLLLGALGAISLLLFVWHGIQILVSAGNKEMVSAGFKGMVNTLIGILLILGSWLIVNVVIAAFTGQMGNVSAVKLFGGQWNVCGLTSYKK